MNFIIKKVDAQGLTSFYDGGIFQEELSQAKAISGIESARFLQGQFQAIHITSEVSKVAIKSTIELA